MEFLISNSNFAGCEMITENLYATGESREFNNTVYYFDGFTADNDFWANPAENLAKKPLGAYNAITIDKQSGILTLQSDKRTIIPIYIYSNKGKFAISNNPWLIARFYKDEIEINEDSLKSQLVYSLDIVPGRTIIKDLSRVKAGETIIFNSRNGELKKVEGYKFEYQPDENTTLEKELVKADEQFTRYFEMIRDQNPGEIAGFGCSGGLDSRLIAHYTSKVGIPAEYFVIGERTPNHIADSVTYVVSSKVAGYYNHTIKQISYNIDWLEQSLMLDIRNHPFFFAQLFINPVDDLPEYSYHLAGDPGGYAYLTDAVISNSLTRLKQHADFFLGMRKDANVGFIDKFRKSAHHLGISIDKYKDEGFYGLNNSLIDSVIDKSVIADSRRELGEVIDQIPGKNNVEVWYYIHDNITCSYQYASAYTGMNRTKKTYPLYYPFYYDQLKHFPISFFKDKYFLKNLLLYVNPDFANIPDQNFNLLNKNQNFVKKLLNRAELGIRGRGLQILNLLKSKKYTDLFKKVYDRENPIFEKYVNRESVLKSKLPQTYAGTQFLKLKMLCDIIYYKEFDILFKNPNYIMK